MYQYSSYFQEGGLTARQAVYDPDPQFHLRLCFLNHFQYNCCTLHFQENRCQTRSMQEVNWWVLLKILKYICIEMEKSENEHKLGHSAITISPQLNPWVLWSWTGPLELTYDRARRLYIYIQHSNSDASRKNSFLWER